METVHSDGVDLAERPVLQTPGDDVFDRVENLVPVHRHQHRELMIDYFRAQKLISNGVVEGLNNKLKSQ